ncbi:MAG: U32 family peptidase [Ruminococcus sp.]|nr:U32 family peptidase [Ruminococcus sp.]
MSSMEILAPSGSPEALTAALRAGADAVYVGGKKFSARNNAANFDDAELKNAVKLCHIHNAKLYLAVNTIIADEEVSEFRSFIKKAAEYGVDGFIVQDIGAADIIRTAVPDAVLHGSTQLSVHTAAGVHFLKEMGFVRAVPARELSAGALEKICREDIETEVFVHGALCMSVSGQCYMSAVIGSRSANRGCCGQACRLPFSADGNKNHAALSLKDLSLMENTDKLREIGVNSLKIEGRMKRPEYIAAAVSQLKNALDGTAPDMKMLRGIFSRSGFTDGYFTGNRRDMFGVREKEDVIAAKDIFPAIHELCRNERKVYTVDFHGIVKENQPVKIIASLENISVEAVGDIPDIAQKSPTTEDSLAKQLSKLGDTVFSLGKITSDIDDGLFVPAGRLNELRRLAVEQLSDAVISRNTPVYTITDNSPALPQNIPVHTDENIPVRTFCRTAEQAAAAAELSEYVVIPESIINQQLTETVPMEKIIVSPPRFIVDEDKIISRLAELKNLGFRHLLCHTLDSAAIGGQLGFVLHGSFTMNLFNSYSAEYLRRIGFEDCIVSPEMTLAQLENLRTELPLGALVYGRLPLMLTRNCPIKNEIGCKNCSGALIDRTSRQLPVACSADYVEILNSDILCMTDRMNKLKSAAFAAVILHDENREQTISAISGKKPDSAVTRGLYYRGVLENI